MLAKHLLGPAHPAASSRRASQIYPYGISGQQAVTLQFLHVSSAVRKGDITEPGDQLSCDRSLCHV